MNITERFWKRFFDALGDEMPCVHRNTYTRIDKVVGTCETTTDVCIACGAELETKTDCA